MSGWTRRRFWSDATVTEDLGGFGIALDGRPVRTPAKSALTLPTRALAEAVAAEWQAQGEIVLPATMPMTRMANSAIDKVAPQREEVVRHLASYGDTDLVCYRASEPAELLRRQEEAWDPWLAWLKERYGVALRPVTGVMHQAQDAAALSVLEAEIGRFTVHELVAFHDLVALSGSLVLGFAVTSGSADLDEIWDRARVDELWQIEQWGADDEAERANALKKKEFGEAARFFSSASDLR